MRSNAASIGLSLLLMVILQIAQPLARQSTATDTLEQILSRYYAAADQYRQAFKNLVVEETRVIEVHKADGTLDKRRQIISDLVVYNPSRGGGVQATEFRDVREVDGKAVAQRGERALQILTAASTADSLERELKIINDQTSKYEFRAHIRGYTINLATPFRDRRDFFHVELNGRDSIDGRQVLLVGYRQTAPLPGARRSKWPGFPEQPPLQQGRLWLDVETGQVRRTELEYTVTHPSSQDRVPYVRLEQTYGSSQFGILVPQHLVFTTFVHGRARNGRPTLALRERSTFTYGSFKRFGITSEEVFAAPSNP
jgi:hypothetical protein